jgi:multiple sugar transport system permease protein
VNATWITGGKQRHWLTTLGILVLDLVVLLWFAFPIFWMALSAFKSQAGMFTMPPTFIFTPTLFNYEHLIDRGALLYFRNSLLASLGTVLVATTLGALAGYGLARGRFRFKKDVAWWIITTRMAPIPAVLVPLYVIFRNLGMLNSIPGLVFAFTTFSLPLAVWLMMSFFRDVPKDLEEAVWVDGGTVFHSFFHVALPLVTPGLIATATLSFIFSWNDYLFATVLTSGDTQTLPVVTASLQTMHGVVWGQVMSMGTLIFIPVLLLGIAIRKYLVRGLSLGAIK